MNNNPILYIDTYLTDSKLHAKNPIFEEIFDELSQFRVDNKNYKEHKKVEIFKYTLLSYSAVNWKKIYINFECENESDSDSVKDFALNLFPNAVIRTKRSSTAKLFYDNLSKIEAEEDSWVFFSPNNDHPIISNKKIDFNEIITKAEIIFTENIHMNGFKVIESIAFSHYHEMMNSIKLTDPLYGYNNRFNKLIYEDANSILLDLSAPMLDSLYIYRLRDILDLFSAEADDIDKRIVRLEDLKIYMSNSGLKQYVFAMKYEICRHYDAYNHTRNYTKNYIDFLKCPPLFIPNNIFGGRIELGYNQNIEIEDGMREGGKNFNHLFLQSDPIPYFWHNYLSKNSIENLNKINSNWKSIEIKFNAVTPLNKLYNFIKSCRLYCIYNLKNIFLKIINK